MAQDRHTWAAELQELHYLSQRPFASAVTMQASTYAIDSMVDNLFRASQLTRDEFYRKKQLTVKKSFEAYVLPFKLTEGDRTLSTGLRGIMTAPCDLPASFPSINLDQHIPSLYLEVPKKVIQYVPSAVPIVDPASKAKQTRVKVPRGPQRQFKAAKSALPEVASIYAEGHESDHDQPASKRARVSMGRASLDDEARRPPLVTPVVAEPEKINRRAIPSNFYTVVQPLFQEFWEMEFDSDEVTYAFFARITNMNCRDFKLEAFAERSYCLEVIKEKLKQQAYVSPEDFAYDFSQLFSNVTTYYPASHPAYAKAHELSALFDTRWRAAQAKFR